MNKNTKRSLLPILFRWISTPVCIVMLPLRSAAQSPTSSGASAEAAIELSPFEVRSEKDNGWAAGSSLSGSRLSQDLLTTGTAVQVILRDQMADFGISNVQEAMSLATGAAVANDSTIGSTDGDGQSVFSYQNYSFSIRGIQPTVTRDFFQWTVNSDSYNIARVDISRGPNSLLFGDSSLSGVVNLTPVQAKLNDKRISSQFTAEYRSVGGYRTIADVNVPFAKQKMAVRVMAMRQDIDSWRSVGNEKKNGAFATFQAKPFSGTQVTVNGEWGSQRAIWPNGYFGANLQGWDHTATGAGTVANNAQYTHVIDMGNPSAGLANWQGFRRTDSNLGTVPVTYVAPRDFLLPGLDARGKVDVLSTALPNSQHTAAILPLGYATNAASTAVKSNYRTGSVILDQRIGRKLYLQTAANVQIEDRTYYSPQAATNGGAAAGVGSLIYDLSSTLPGGGSNPNYGRAYTEARVYAARRVTENREARVSASYELDLPIVKLNLAGLASWRNSEYEEVRSHLMFIPASGSMSAVANQVIIRGYLDTPNAIHVSDLFPAPTYSPDRVLTPGTPNWVVLRSGTGIGTTTPIIRPVVTRSVQAAANGSWFNGRLVTQAGIRRDSYSADNITTNVNDYNASSNRWLGSYGQRLSATGSSNSPSYMAVLKLSSWLYLFANQTTSFQVGAAGGKNYLGQAIPPTTGEGRDYGVRLSLMDGRLTASVTKYRSTQLNQIGGANANALRPALQTLLPTPPAATGLSSWDSLSDTIDGTSKGWEIEINGKVSRHWSVSANAGLPDTITDVGEVNPSFKALVAPYQADWLGKANGTIPLLPGDLSQATYASQTSLYLDAISLAEANRTALKAKYVKINTKYDLSEGWANGLSIGGGVNFVLASEVVLSAPQTIAPFARRFSSPGYHTANIFLSYRMKLGKVPFVWRLNVNNLFDEVNLRYTRATYAGAASLPTYASPTGINYTQYRIETPREIRLSGTFSF